MSGETTPKWRKDFPIEWGADNYVTRREFTKFLVLISGATFVGNGYFVLQKYREQREPFPSLEVAAVDAIQPGQVKLFRYPTEDDPAMLIRLASGEFVAYKQRCTHLSCPVHYAAQRNRLECPCHNGAFDAATGAVLQGPPPRPLPKITLRIANGKIYAEGVQGS
ncbi:MAG TPA: Rieske 2Fe-2S domain-containing protein [Chthonomonadaceae bacterium]|nr:Rieske 2Fe-2S domain-containing protein [Chthonomonadaceae bacterium]